MVVLACSCKSTPDERQPAPPTPVTPAPVTPDAAVPSSPTAERLMSLLKLTNQQTGSVDDMLAKIAKLRASAPPDEQPLFDQMLAMAREYKAAETDKAHRSEHIVAATKQMLAALPAMADRTKADVATQRMLIASLSMLPQQIENLELADQFDLDAIKRDSLVRSRELVKAFPRDARAWRQLGMLTDRFTSGPAAWDAAIRAYQMCVQLEPAQPNCSQPLARLRQDYTAPYCEATAIKPGLGWFEATGAGTAATPKFSSRDLVRVRAIVVHSEASPVTDMTTGKVVDTMPARDTPVVVVELAPAAVKPMFQWRSHIQRPGYYVVKLGARMIESTEDSVRSYGEEAEHRFGGITIDDLCTTTQRRALPPDLAR
jgi:hypothetical protein